MPDPIAIRIPHKAFVKVEEELGPMVAYVLYEGRGEEHKGIRLFAQGGLWVDLFDAELWLKEKFSVVK